jgi:hypothetical protein
MTAETTDEAYRFLCKKIGSRRTFFHHIRMLSNYFDFLKVEAICRSFLMRGQEIESQAA